MGLGVSVVPDFVIRPLDRKGLAARSVREFLGRETYGIATRQGRKVSRAAQTLLDLLGSAG
jgi:DNA-binding transcriptional LysR family regulator